MESQLWVLKTVVIVPLGLDRWKKNLIVQFCKVRYNDENKDTVLIWPKFYKTKVGDVNSYYVHWMKPKTIHTSIHLLSLMKPKTVHTNTIFIVQSIVFDETEDMQRVQNE